MKRCLLVLAFLPQFTGCLYYAYPTASYVSAPPVPNQDGSVHAFRIDIDRTDRARAPASAEYSLMRIPIDSKGNIPSQLEIAPATGVYDPLGLGAGVAHEKNQYSMLVRFYRPGYRTIEIKAWDKSRDLQWSAAPDLLAQEQAIDELLADPAAPQRPLDGTVKYIGSIVTVSWWEQKEQKQPGLGLLPGANSASQRKALMFAAGEYERLANSAAANVPTAQTNRERLQQKAIWLRRFAEQAPVR